LAPNTAPGSSTVDDPSQISLDQIQRQDVILLTGTHYIAKNDRHPNRRDQVRIALCLFNTVDEHNDLVISFNVPITSINPYDSGSEVAERVGWDQAKEDFIELVKSLTVKPGLFRPSSDP
jgi:hypothetical protein